MLMIASSGPSLEIFQFRCHWMSEEMFFERSLVWPSKHFGILYRVFVHVQIATVVFLLSKRGTKRTHDAPAQAAREIDPAGAVDVSLDLSASLGQNQQRVSPEYPHNQILIDGR